MADFSADKPCRILSLDGGGAKGFYTLGVLREIEGLIGCPIHERFDLIFGTSTGAIIAALLGLGKSVKEISGLYEQHVPTVMSKKSRHEKSRALAKLADTVFKDDKFDKMKTGVGIVTTKWVIERPRQQRNRQSLSAVRDVHARLDYADVISGSYRHESSFSDTGRHNLEVGIIEIAHRLELSARLAPMSTVVGKPLEIAV